MRRPAKDRRFKVCQWCLRNFGVEQMTRTQAECPLHHAVTFCKVHGAINCGTGRDGCPGSAKYPDASIPDVV